MKFRRFTKEDWFGWAGACPFPATKGEPFIATLKIKRGTMVMDAVALVSGEEPGILEIDIFEDEDGKTQVWQVMGGQAFECLLMLSAYNAEEPMAYEELQRTGWRRTD